MTTAHPNEATAAARDLMDKALAAENGVRVTLLDTKYGGSAGAKKIAEDWQQRVFTARSQMRRVQARIASGGDAAQRAAFGEAADPDAVKTAYDKLWTAITRNEANTGWVLSINNVDLSKIFDDIEVF